MFSIRRYLYVRRGDNHLVGIILIDSDVCVHETAACIEVKYFDEQIMVRKVSLSK